MSELVVQDFIKEKTQLRRSLVDIMLEHLSAEGQEPNNFVKQGESAMYEAVMKQVKGNQARGDKLLGVSDGHLRMKLMRHFNTTKVGGLYYSKPNARVDEVSRRVKSMI